MYQGLGADPSEALYLAFVADGWCFSVFFFLVWLIPPSVFGEHALRVMAEYPPHTGGRSILHTLSLLGTDFIMACPTRAVARSVPGAFLYYFDHVMSFSKVGWGPTYRECWNLTCHGEELPFVFGSAGLVLKNPYTAAEKTLVSAMQAAWLSFVASSAAPAPWQPFSNASQAAMFFATPVSQVARFPRQDKCDFFDSIGYGRAGRFLQRLAKMRSS